MFRSTKAAPMLTGVFALLAAAGPSQAAGPNVVLIVADDFGYGDLSIHGCQDIPTPHLDSLANGGVRCSAG